MNDQPSRCACVPLDAQDCANARYPGSRLHPGDSGEEPEPCGCGCHDHPDTDLDDIEEADPLPW